MYRKVVGLLLGLCPYLAYAVTDCSVSTVPVTFGVYDDLYYDLDTSSGGVTVSCTVISAPPGSVSYTVKFSSGNAPSFAPRQMRNGAYIMNYNLYVNGSRNVSSIWGDGTSGTQVMPGTVTQLDTVGAVRSVDHVVYGRVPKGQGGLGVGSYTDTLVVTLTF